jgi:hypothetical protein
VSLNVQDCESLDTLAEEILDRVASRVFARSAFEYGHEPDVLAAEAAACVVTVLQPELAPAVLCPPQAEIANPAVTARTASLIAR